MGRTHLLWLVVLSGCAEGVDPAPAGPEPAAPVLKSGETLAFIHVGGLCSTGFVSTSRKGAHRLGSWPGVVSVDAPIDQRRSMAEASAQLADLLDTWCRGDGWCYVYAYSNGGAVLSKTLSDYDGESWNILWALTTASNEGGSEVSGSLTAEAIVALDLYCPLADQVSPTEHRAGWNHDDTGGHAIYTIAGHHELFYTGKLPDFFQGMANDGMVAYHSSGGMNDVWFVPDDDPWLCYEPRYRFAWHTVAYTCEGDNLDHYGMVLQGLEDLGG